MRCLVEYKYQIFRREITDLHFQQPPDVFICECNTENEVEEKLKELPEVPWTKYIYKRIEKILKTYNLTLARGTKLKNYIKQ